MKKNNIKNKSSLLVLLYLLGTLPLWAQEKASTSTANNSFVLDANSVLVFAALILLMVIAVLGYTLLASIDLFKKRKKESKGATGQVIKTLLIAFLSLGAIQAFGQDAAANAAAPATSLFTDAKILRYILFGLIAIELIIIFGMVYWIRFFTGIADLQREKEIERKIVLKDASSWWSRMNKLKPLDQEASLDIGHSYDGIKELDNTTPPWFTISFIATVLFGIGYFWYYQVAKAGPNQIEEYEIAVTKANLAKDAYLKSKGDAVNENTVTMLDAAGITAGKGLYASNCVACHGDAGQGGVGPNLTDKYWLHGGSIGDVFKTIKFGVVEKGMMSWKDVFSADQIAELASYIESIHDTNPAGAKEPQGELYKATPNAAEGAAPANTDSTSAEKK